MAARPLPLLGTTSAPRGDNKAFFDKVNATFPQDNFLTWKVKVSPDADPEWTRLMADYHTAIEPVLLREKLKIPDKLTAALVLCERCDVDPKLLGYSGPPQPLPPPPPKLEAKPFVLRDPKTLTKRDWIYGTQLIRKFGSATFAPSGSGKSNLMIVEALAIATGRPLLGITPPKRARVWYWNGEDPMTNWNGGSGPPACITASRLRSWMAGCSSIPGAILAPRS